MYFKSTSAGIRLATPEGMADLPESEKRYRTFFDYLPAPAYSCDAQGRITHYNRPAVELFGRTPRLNDDTELYCGAHRIYFADGTPVKHGQCWMGRVLQEGSSFNGCEAIIERPDGERRLVLAHANPIFDAGGKVVGAINVMIDITESRQAEEQAHLQAQAAESLRREQDALRVAISGMEQVLGVVGHELRTPLAAVRAISEFLVTDGARGTPEFHRFLLEMSLEVDRMSDTVNNILEAARINSGRARWNWSSVVLGELLHDAAETIRPLIDASKVRLIVNDDCRQTSSLMRGDAEAIRRLIVNLLSNARKHTKAGSIELHCHSFSAGEGDAWIELAVRDTGSGIPPKVMERLGEAFALNSGVVGANACSGTGLGLSICRGIARAHGGYLRVLDTGPGGTTIVARLRAELPEAAEGDTSYLEACDPDLEIGGESTSTAAVERLCT